MGMSNYIMDLQEQFEIKCEEIAVESESFIEYAEKAVLNDKMVAWLDEQEVADIIEYVWNECWKKCINL